METTVTPEAVPIAGANQSAFSAREVVRQAQFEVGHRLQQLEKTMRRISTVKKTQPDSLPPYFRKEYTT